MLRGEATFCELQTNPRSSSASQTGCSSGEKKRAGTKLHKHALVCPLVTLFLPLLLNIHSQPLRPSGGLGLHVTWRDVIHYLTFQWSLGGPPLLHSWLSLPADRASLLLSLPGVRLRLWNVSERIIDLVDVKSEVFAASSLPTVAFFFVLFFTVDSL